MTLSLPENISTGRVEWQAISDVTDGPDADQKPDVIAPTGTVNFVASTTVLRNLTSAPNPVSVLRDPIVGVLDSEGYLCTPNADGTPAYRGVELIATDDPDLNPADWVYNVTYDLLGRNGRELELTSHQIYVPAGATVDLTSVGPVDNATAIGIPAAEALAAQAAAAASDASVAASQALAAAAAAEAALVDSDAFVADKIEDPASATQAALNAQIAEGVEAETVNLARRGAPLLRSAPDLRRFRAAFASARFSQIAIVVEGDSVVAGGNSGNEVPNTNAQKLTALVRGWVSQFRALLVAFLGIDAGEGWVGLAGDEGRWTFDGVTPGPIAIGPVATGVRLSAGNAATATGQDFAFLDVTGFSGGAVTHPPRIEVDDVDVRPSRLNADAKNGVVASGKWAAVGVNTTVAQSGARDITLTAIGAGAARADYGSATGEFNVTAGDVLFFSAAGMGDNARQYGISAYFYNSSGTQVGGELTCNGTTGVGSYTQASAFITVPAGATTMKPVLRAIAGLNAGETIHIKDFDAIPVQVWTGVGGTAYKMSTIAVTPGLHKLRIIAPNANQADIGGVCLRKRTDAGVLVHRIAKSGTTTADHLTNASGANATAQQLLAQYEMLHAIAPVRLRIIALGKNDFGGQATNGITPASYRANLSALAAKGIGLGEDIILAADERYSDDAGRTYPEASYYAEAADLADDTDRTAYVDFIETHGDKATSTALGFRDPAFGIHPTLAGHGDMALGWLDVVTRQVVTQV